MRVIDLSQRLSPATSDIEVMPHRIEYFTHEESAKQVSPGLGTDDGPLAGRVRVGVRADHPDPRTPATHLDAPYHYGPAGRGGSRPRTIDEGPVPVGDG